MRDILLTICCFIGVIIMTLMGLVFIAGAILQIAIKRCQAYWRGVRSN